MRSKISFQCLVLPLDACFCWVSPPCSSVLKKRKNDGKLNKIIPSWLLAIVGSFLKREKLSCTALTYTVTLSPYIDFALNTVISVVVHTSTIRYHSVSGTSNLGESLWQQKNSSNLCLMYTVYSASGICSN